MLLNSEDFLNEDIFLIDFGMSKRFLSAEGSHEPQKHENFFYGNLLFSSAYSQKFLSKLQNIQKFQVPLEEMTLFHLHIFWCI